MGLFSKHKDPHGTGSPKHGTTKESGQNGKTSATTSVAAKNTSKTEHNKDQETKKKEELEDPNEDQDTKHEKDQDTENDEEKENDELVEEDEQKKVYTKEKAPTNDGFEIQLGASEAETETYINTKLNALLYHISDDSIDRYKSENTQSDLLGRLYYDDYDPSNRSAVESFTSLVHLSPPRSGTSSKSGFSKSGIVQKLEGSISGSKTDVSEASSVSGSVPGSKSSSAMFEVGEDTQSAPTISNEKPVRPSFASQVSFDTLSDFHHQAITLKAKHPEFKFRRNNKCFLIGFNNDSESFKAVEWAFLEMVVHGDTIIVLHVLDSKSHKGLDRSMADAIFEKIKSLNTHRRKISIVFESVIGQPQKLLKQAIAEYKPAMMIVGTSHYGQTSAPSSRGNSSTNLHSQSSRLHMPFFSKVSISKYFLQFALVPVILVKPFYEIHESLERPIDGEHYFSHWLAGIDVSHTYEKKKKFLSMRSPSASRNSSHTSLVDLETQSRGRSDLFTMASRDSSASRSQSRTARTEGRSSHREQNRSLSRVDKDLLHEDERARSRSRSRLSRIFSN